MRLAWALAITAASLIPMVAVAADDMSAVVAKQRDTAETNCRTVQLVPVVTAESQTFLVVGTSPQPRLKSLAAGLEKQFATAFRALQFDREDKPWTGKLAVYVFSERSQYRSFVRQVEKRSPDDGEQSSNSVSGDTPHVAVSPGQAKDAPSPDAAAGQEIAIALITARSKSTPLPEWLTQGFARATAAQAANLPAGVRKRGARQLAGRLKPSEAWNEMLPFEQRLPLATSVADYLFYGKGLSRPADFLMAFRPDDEKPMKTTADALEAMKVTMDQFEAGYLKWLRSNN
jgi:hypothetical protein